jgi:hypothetical protein
MTTSAVRPLAVRRRRRLDHLGEGVGGVGLEPFHLVPALLRGESQSLRLALQSVHEGHADVGGEAEGAGDHAEVVAPVPHRSRAAANAFSARLNFLTSVAQSSPEYSPGSKSRNTRTSSST